MVELKPSYGRIGAGQAFLGRAWVTASLAGLGSRLPSSGYIVLAPAGNWAAKTNSKRGFTVCNRVHRVCAGSS